LEIRFGAKHFEQVVAHSRESEVVVVRLVPCVAAHELHSRQAGASEEPAPDVVEEKAKAEQAVKADQEIHEGLV